MRLGRWFHGTVKGMWGRAMVEQVEGNRSLLCGPDSGVLHRAVSANHGIEDLILQGADPNSLVKWGSGTISPLHLAASGGRLATCKTLLDHGADVNIRTPSGRTPLMSASEAGRADVVSLLLMKGAVKGLVATVSYYQRHSEVSGMLQYGSGGYIRGNKATLRALEGLSEEDKLVVMFRASCSNYPDELEILLSLGVCPDVLWQWMGTQVSPLHVAASSGHMAACRTLLDHGADVNIRTPSGMTPLMSASQAGRADVVSLLLECKKSSKAEDLLSAARVGDSTLCRLLRGGSDPNRLFRSRNSNVSPLHVAASSGHMAACRTLLDHGADVNIKTPSGWTPLMSASETGRADVVSLLLTKGAVKGLMADVSCYQRHSEVSEMLRYGSGGYIRGNKATLKAMEGLSEEDKLAVMFRASSRNFLDELEILLSLGVCPDVLRQWRGNSVSPLHVAASSGHMAACRTLLDHGADVNIRTLSGTTPLISARRANRVDVVTLLLGSGATCPKQ